MYHRYILVAAALTAITTASPIEAATLETRAGAPIARPIPSDCKIKDPLDHCDPAVRYRPTAAANSTILYSYYLQPDSFTVTTDNASALFDQCLQTCYGYGDTGDCKSAYLAYEYPMPPEFGLPGGNEVVACLMWGKVVTAEDFEAVPANVTGYGNSTAGVIACPA